MTYDKGSTSEVNSDRDISMTAYCCVPSIALRVERVFYVPLQSAAEKEREKKIGDGGNRTRTQRSQLASAVHFSSLVSQRCKVYRSVDNDDKVPRRMKPGRAG